MTRTNEPSVAAGPRHLRLVAALLAFVGLAACHETSVERVATTAAVPVAVETAKLDTMTSTIVASGLVTAAPGAELTVMAPEAARIAEMPRAEGEPVKAGDLLVRFEMPALASDVAARRAAVAQASARLEAANASFNRLTSLLSQGVAAPREVEEAKRQQAEAAADLEDFEQAALNAEASEARPTATPRRLRAVDQS